MHTMIKISLLALIAAVSIPQGFSQEKELRQANADFNDLQYSKAAEGYLSALGKIESIKKLGKDVRDLTVRFNEAQKKLVGQVREMKSADTVTKEMTAAYKSAQRSP